MIITIMIIRIRRIRRIIIVIMIIRVLLLVIIIRRRRRLITITIVPGLVAHKLVVHGLPDQVPVGLLVICVFVIC